MSKAIRVLIVEDSHDDALLLVRELRRGGFEPEFERVETAETMARALADSKWDLILSDYAMPQFSGIAALELLKRSGVDLPFIVVSGSIGEDIAVAAMKSGAHDYLMKGNIKRLSAAIDRELREADVRFQQRQADANAKRNAERIRALHEIDLAIMSTLELRELLGILMDKIDLTLPNMAITIRLFNKKSGELEPAACRNINEKEWLGLRRPGLRGLTKIVLENRLPITVSDVSSDPRSSASEFARKEGLGSFLGIPLIAKDEILGLMAFYTREKHAFTDDEIEFLTTFAGQAAIGIYHASLYEQVKQRSDELSALYSIADIASKFLDINSVLLEAMRTISGIFGFQAGRIYLLDKLNRELRLVAHEGFPSDLVLPASYRIGEGLLGKAFERDEALLFEDIQNADEFQRLSSRKVMLSSGFRGSFFVPIRVREENLGVMNFLSKEARRFSSDDIRLINTIGYHLGVAVGNANLFFEIRHKSLELRKANEVKDQFLAVISHELRTPLNVSMGYMTVVRDRMLGEITPAQEAALETSLRHSHELLEMIDSVLSVQAIEGDAIEKLFGEVNLGKLLDELKTYYTMISGQNISLLWDYPHDLPVIRSDRDKIKHILQNLVGNALKFTEKGSVTVTARHLGHTDMVELKVSDTGIGIPEDQLRDIFERFRQLDGSETRKYGGIGVGLFIVKKFTELLGGTVTVKSELNHGSTFTVTLPIEMTGPKNQALTGALSTRPGREFMGSGIAQKRSAV